MPIQMKQLSQKSSQTIFLFIHYNSLLSVINQINLPFPGRAVIAKCKLKHIICDIWYLIWRKIFMKV